jgi:hypothetical protein
MSLVQPTAEQIEQLLAELVAQTRLADWSEVARRSFVPLAHLLAARFAHDVDNGGFAQLLYNMGGEYLPEIEDMLFAAQAENAQDYYVRAIRVCLPNKDEYLRFLKSNYLDRNEVKHQLQLLSVEYLRGTVPFRYEASEYLATIWRSRAYPAVATDRGNA